MTSARRRDTHCRAEGVGGVFSLPADGVPTLGLSLDGPAAGSRRLWELDWDLEATRSCQVDRDAKPSNAPVYIPRALMRGTTERVAGPRPTPKGLPKLFPIDRTWCPPRMGRLDALAWGYADTSPLQNAILIWLQFGRGEYKVRQAICHRARKWPMSSGRRDLIVDTALAHAPALTYNQHPPSWLNYQSEFVNQVNEVLGWINQELQIAIEATSLTRYKKNGPKCDNGIRDTGLPARFSESLAKLAA